MFLVLVFSDSPCLHAARSPPVFPLAGCQKRKALGPWFPLQAALAGYPAMSAPVRSEQWPVTRDPLTDFKYRYLLIADFIGNQIARARLGISYIERYGVHDT
jgi:hypothetical protein